MPVIEVTSAGKCMNVRAVSCLHVAASRDASGRLMTADNFCNISSHPQRPCMFTVLAQMQILSQLTWQATQHCCLCSEVANDPSSKVRDVHVTLVLMKQHSTKGKVPRNLKAHLPFLCYEILIKSCVNDK